VTFSSGPQPTFLPVLHTFLIHVTGPHPFSSLLSLTQEIPVSSRKQRQLHKSGLRGLFELGIKLHLTSAMRSNWGPYICEAPIGSGGFATVIRARHSGTFEYVAIKLIGKDQVRTEADRTRLFREISILKQVDHPFIAKSFFCDEDDEHYAIIQEYAPQGTLAELITRNGVLSEPQMQHYFIQIVSALDYLHNVKKVTHRDLKLENIMLDVYNNVKLIDFGLSQVFLDPEGQFTTPCGSLPYLPPELISTGRYSRAADVWSLGIVLYALATGKLPFAHKDFSVLCRQIVASHIRYPGTLNEDLTDLLRRMLCRDPAKRITIEQIKQHPWFPLQEYTSIVEAIESLGPEDPTALDPEVVAQMTAHDMDCSKLEAALAAGEENDLTVLYSVYQRKELSHKVNRILRSLTPDPGLPPSQMSMRVIHPPPLTPRGAGLTKIRVASMSPATERDPGPGDRILPRRGSDSNPAKRYRMPLQRPPARPLMVAPSILDEFP
jgi:serine/threonine protein kinase